jgi:hypothetical protein
MGVVEVLLAHAHLLPAVAGTAAAGAQQPAVAAGVCSQYGLLKAIAEAARNQHWSVWSLLVRVVDQCFPDALGGVTRWVHNEQAVRALLRVGQEDMAAVEQERAAVARERQEVEELRHGVQHLIMQMALSQKQTNNTSCY